MKYLLRPIIVLTLLIGILSSCIRNESASTLCDIIAIDSKWLKTLPKGTIVGTPQIKQSQPARITILVKEDNYDTIRNLSPKFIISNGATLFHRNGNTLIPYDETQTYDFTKPQTFSVQSEDGHFIKDYLIRFTIPLPLNSCDFDHYGYEGTKRAKYMVLYQKQEDGSTNGNIWASGNPGYDIPGYAETSEDFPTSFRLDNSTGQHYACLVTRDTKSFGMMTRPKMPIAGGNLFIGEFVLRKATKKPREATRFGLPIAKGKPLYLKGAYKYTPGEVYTDENKKEISEKKDSADIYAVLYEIDPQNFEPLNGDNILTSPRVVMRARMDNPGSPKEWTPFTIPFQLMPGKEYDETRMLNDGYAYAIVMTSSRHADHFCGAIGSTLCIDHIETVWQ